MAAKTKVYKNMNEQEIERFREFLQRFGENSGSLGDIFGDTVKDAGTFQKEFDKLTKNVKKGNASFSDLKSKISELDDSIEDLSKGAGKLTSAERAAELAVKKKMKADMEATAANQLLAEQTAKVSKDSLNSASDAIGRFVKGLQSDASGTQLASDLMIGGLEILGTTAKGAGKILGSLGDVAMARGAMTLNPYVVAAGGALKILGTVVDSSSETMTKFAKFGIEVLAKEVERTYTAFNTMSSAGAIFADGMDGMRNAAIGAGLTVEQMSTAVKNSSDSIAAAGLGVTEGVKMLGRVGKAMQESGAQEQLLKLGYGFEEQVELMADVTRRLRLTGKSVTDADVQSATKQYAENLRLIAEITGEDAKKKMEEAEVASRELIFRQRIAQMGLDINQVIQGMAPLPKVAKQSLIDMVATNGAIINQSGAIMKGQVRGFDPMMKEIYATLKTGKLTTTASAEAMAKFGPQIGNSIKNATHFGMALRYGGDDMGDLQEAMTSMWDASQKVTKSSVQSAQENISGAEAAKGFTQEVIDAEKAAQRLKVALQENLTKAITDFEHVSVQMLGVVQDMLDKLGYGNGRTPGKTPQEITSQNVQQAEQKTSEANKALQEQYKKEGWKDPIDGALFSNSKEVRDLRKKANAAEAQEDKIKEARVNYLSGLNQVNKRLQKEADEKQFGFLGALGIKGGAQVDPDKLKSAIDEYNKNFATMDNVLDPVQAQKRKEWAKALGMTQESNYAPAEPIKKYAEGGTIDAGKTGIVGEAGPELISGPASVTSADATKTLQESIAKLHQMVAGLKTVTAEQSADLAGMMYSGTLGGKDFKPATWASLPGAGNAGVIPKNAMAAIGQLENYLKDIEKGETAGAPSLYKQLAEGAVKMVETAKQQSELPNTPTEKLITVLDSMREMKGVRFGENDFDWKVNMQDERFATIKDRIKGFEKIDPEMLKQELENRPEMAAMRKARDAMMEGEDSPVKSMGDLHGKFDELIGLMKENVDQTAKVAHNTH